MCTSKRVKGFEEGGVTISADSGPCLHFVLSRIVKCVKSQDSRNLAMNGF